ncbi:MAG: Calx-beta domain-containing protein, partial [Acidimicrobiales bacterium]
MLIDQASAVGAAPSRALATPVTTPTISAPPDVVVGEATGHVTLPVTLSTASLTTVSVKYATASVTASTANSSCSNSRDFVGATGTLNFAPGETTKVVRVDLFDCQQSATYGFRSFTFNLATPKNATIARASGRIDITGDAFGPPTVAPGLYARSAIVDTDVGTVDVPVLLGGPSGVASKTTVTVHYATHNATATAGTDYTTKSGTLVFTPGQTVQNIPITIVNRSGSVPTRTFTVTLSSPSHAVVVQSQGVVTIGASGATAVTKPTVSAPPDVVAGNADGYIDLPVTLSAPSSTTVSVKYATASVTASTGNSYCSNSRDFVGATGTLNFAPGETTKVARVDLFDCQKSATYGFRSFTFNLQKTPKNATIARASTRIDITGDAKGTPTVAPGLYARDAIVDTDVGTVDVPVLLGGPAGVASATIVTVHYATHNATATAGTDYTTKSGTLTFGPGQTVQNIPITFVNRSGSVPTRTFTVTLSSPTHSAIADSTGVVTIGASGAATVATPAVSAPPNVVVVDTGGYIDLPVTLGAPSQTTVTVTYKTVNDTAFSGTGCSDAYVAANGTLDGPLNFAPGETTKTVRVDLLNCNVSGTFTFVLFTPKNATIARATESISVVTSATDPGAPTGVTAVGGNKSAVVSFNSPATDGGESVNYYTVTSSPGTVKASSAASPITVSGLTNGVTYTFKVTATNTVGTGPSSTPSNKVTPATASIAITTKSLSTGTVGVPYQATLKATGGTTPYKWSVSGMLPKGLTLTAASGKISGTPAAAGSFTFTAKVSGAATSGTGSAPLSIS